MWTEYNLGHPALTDVYGSLPGSESPDPNTNSKSLVKGIVWSGYC